LESTVLSVKYIDLYLELEITMAKLYQRFEKRYAAHKDFWISLIADEHEHAGYIKHFHDLNALNKISFAEGKTRIAALQSILAYINSLIAEFDKQPFLFQKAISICLDLERSVIERDIFKRFDSDSTELRQLLDILRQAQEEHVHKIKKFNVMIQGKSER
jgi:hypothetical protein